MIEASPTIAPFTFDRVFTAAPPPTRSAEEGAKRCYELEAELERREVEHAAAVAQARIEGFEAGLAQARGERETALLAAVDALQASIEAVDDELDDITVRLTRDAAHVAISAADLMAAQTIATAPGVAVDAAIGRVLRQVARGTDLLVRVHPDLADDIAARIAARQAIDRRRLNLHVSPDPEIALGDVTIEWDQGMLSLDAAARNAAVRAELGELLTPRPGDPAKTS